MQRLLNITVALILLFITALLTHLTLVVLPAQTASQTYLSVMAECSQRRLAAVAEIKAGAEKAMQDMSEEKKQEIQQSLADTYGTFNSAEFYQKCAETVRKDWSL